MNSRPTITLAVIAKNEAHNLSPFFKSIKGCFDEIVFVDTGSTDNTLQFIKNINDQQKLGAHDWGLPEIKVYHFDWVNDFSKARNFAFDQATKDYVAWMDLDDSMSDPQAFIKWRDNVMHAAHYWLAKYNYAFDDKGNVVCEFVRERVIKRNHGFRWEYAVHEGLLQVEGKKYWAQKANTWWINHRRTEDDRKQDHLRNVKILEALPLDEIHPRMKFYYGKELFENGFHDKAGKPLHEAIKSGKLEHHDLILAIQYAGQSAFAAKAYPQALDLLFNGVKLLPNRAEYWVLIGDIYFVQGNFQNAIHCYKTAMSCTIETRGGMLVVQESAYKDYPLIKLAELYLNMGNCELAFEYIEKIKPLNEQAHGQLIAKYYELKDLGKMPEGLPKADDVIITCHAHAPGDWDEHTLKEKGHGGSETAAIEVAKWIKLKTKKRVKIFQNRKSKDVMPSGVEYCRIQDLKGYLDNLEPAAHIAWRHPSRLTRAKTYSWCHDLQMYGNPEYDKIVALSEFHKNYLIETCQIPEDKIVLGFNGVNPEDFPKDAQKDPLKVIFSSSPDRGLIQSVDIVKKAREISGLDIKLHCFYGTGNMRKMGLIDWAQRIEKHLDDHKEFVTYHGMVTKDVLMKHFSEAAVWLYPSDFIESSCITALEAMCTGAYPIVRNMGALKYTMKDAIEREACDILDIEAIEGDEASTGIWANRLIDAILEKKWERVKFDSHNYSWERVADFFIEQFSL